MKPSAAHPEAAGGIEFLIRLNALTPDLKRELAANLRRDHADEPQMIAMADAIERWIEAKPR